MRRRRGGVPTPKQAARMMSALDELSDAARDQRGAWTAGRPVPIEDVLRAKEAVAAPKPQDIHAMLHVLGCAIEKLALRLTPVLTYPASEAPPAGAARSTVAKGLEEMIASVEALTARVDV